MENKNCSEVLMQVLKENMQYHDRYQRRFNNKVVFFALMASVFAVATTYQIKEQHDQIGRIKYELEELKNEEGE